MIWVSVGGRGTLVGAALGAILVNFAKTWFTGVLPSFWLFALGLLFILVTVFMPKGLLGLFSRYAALGLLGMTAIIQLTVPDGWQNFHLPWASMELAILTFGPGRIALDYVFGLDRVSRPS